MSGIKNRGFASMDPEKRRKIAGLGGKAAWVSGIAHKWTSDEARKAGLISGRIPKNIKEWLICLRILCDQR